MIKLLKNVLTFSLVFVLLINISACGTELYKQEIPTKTEKQATVSLPENWRFTVENDRIYVKDGEKTVATEVYNEWRVKYYLDGVHYDNKNVLNINLELSENLRDLDSYEVIEDDILACDIYKISVAEGERYAIYFTITNHPEQKGAHVLFSVFESEYSDLALLQKITKTYTWGGTSKPQ